MAKLYFRYGAMNSGKSTALMQVAHNYEEQGMKKAEEEYDIFNKTQRIDSDFDKEVRGLLNNE